MELTQSSQEFTRDFGDQLAKAEAHLRSALAMLHQQQDASEHQGRPVPVARQQLLP